MIKFLCPVLYGSNRISYFQKNHVHLSVVTGVNLQTKPFSNVVLNVRLLGYSVMEEI